jgi:hypothetical protein
VILRPICCAARSARQPATLILVLVAVAIALAAPSRTRAAVPAPYAHICSSTGFSSLKIMNLVCDDEDIGALLAHADKMPLVHVDYFWLFDDRLFKECDRADDAKSCLLSGYSRKISDLEDEQRQLRSLYGDSNSVASPRGLMAELSGVYKLRHKYSNLTVGAIEIENILEFVPISADAAYIKIVLYPDTYRDNCAIAGVFQFKNVGGFVFQGDKSPGECLLTVASKDSSLELSDPTGNCQKFCAAHGSWDEVFPRKQRRPIRYMSKILHSSEYQAAVSSYQDQTGGKQ